jgi:ubiquinone/menaquinone biosynthesis C-methylase UbiE
MKPIGSYEDIAEVYSAAVDTKPIHIYYERPHTWSLLPKALSGLNVLDLGCGSGWYAEQLLKAGANVVAVDASAKMVKLTRSRCKNNGKFIVANLEEPLTFLQNNAFDVVLAPLMIHYIKEWQGFFSEISRVLKKQGLFIFSTHQPHTQYKNFNLKNYYEKVLIKDYWPSLKVEVQFYHHTLHDLAECLYNAGFVIEKILEPQPLSELQSVDPDMFKNITTQPWFLFVRAKKSVTRSLKGLLRDAKVTEEDYKKHLRDKYL